VAPLVVAPALGAGAAVDVEAGDDRDDGRDVRLVLRVDDAVGQGRLTGGAAVAGHVDDLIDLRGHGPGGARASLGPARLLRVGLGSGAAEGVGLALAGLLGLVEVPLQVSDLSLQVSDLSLQVGEGGIAPAAARTNRSVQWSGAHTWAELPGPPTPGKRAFVHFTVTTNGCRSLLPRSRPDRQVCPLPEPRPRPARPKTNGR